MTQCPIFQHNSGSSVPWQAEEEEKEITYTRMVAAVSASHASFTRDNMHGSRCILPKYKRTPSVRKLSLPAGFVVWDRLGWNLTMAYLDERRQEQKSDVPPNLTGLIR